ncbi:cytochrome P450 [Pisolithus sp. B1]|nr:cytochrome P450 [Pisolithus sp. B1]
MTSSNQGGKYLKQGDAKCPTGRFAGFLCFWLTKASPFQGVHVPLQSIPIVMFLLALGAACTTIVGLWVLASRAKPKLPYPPGPKGLPFIGNAFDIGPQGLQHTYAQWSKIYGDIVYTRTFGQDVIIVNSEKTARILANGRSEIYSDRYSSPIYKDFGTYRMTFVLEYGKEWKTHRRLFNLSLRNDVVGKYNDLHLNHAHQLSENILCDSTNFFEHVDLYAGAIIIELMYGRRVEGKDDPAFAMASGLAEILSREVTPDRMGLLKVMPFLLYLPSWFPGAGFKRKAAHCRKMAAEMVDLPFAIAKDEMRGVLSHCMISDYIEARGSRGFVGEGRGQRSLSRFVPFPTALKLMVSY